MSDEAYARRDDPQTSHDAAASLTPEALGFLQRGVLNVLKLVWPRGLTTFEIAEAMEVDRDSISPRMASLEAAKLVCNTGEKRIPEGRTRAAIVWRVVREEESEEADFLSRLPADEDIDLSDIPEAAEEFFTRARVVPPPPVRAERPPIELSDEELRWLQKKGGRDKPLHIAFRDGVACLKRGEDGRPMSAWAIEELKKLSGRQVRD